MNTTLNILIPVLNEEKRLESGVTRTLDFLQKHKIPHILSIIDNGSSDSTPLIAQTLCKTHKTLEYLRLEEKGVGLALRAGLAHNASRPSPCGFIGYMDIDLSTDIVHLQEVYEKLCNGKHIVVGSRLLQDSCVIGRSLKREILSRGLNMLLKLILKAKFSDGMCGFKFYHNEVAQILKNECSEDKSWFYCAQMLIIAQYKGYDIQEIAIKWEDETSDSKVKVFSLARIYLKEILRLWRLLRLQPMFSLGAKKPKSDS